MGWAGTYMTGLKLLADRVVLVDLEEGFRMMSRVQGVPAEQVEVGARVTLRLEPTDDGPIPVFVPGGEDS